MLLFSRSNTTQIMYNVTELRVNPDYMYYYIHWTRLLGTGIIPFMYLVYMNLRIYCRKRYSEN